MCLTIPKKVIAKKGDFFVLENQAGTRQKAKSLVDLKVGDYCLTQQGFVVQKIDKGEFEKLLEDINRIGKEE